MPNTSAHREMGTETQRHHLSPARMPASTVNEDDVLAAVWMKGSLSAFRASTLVPPAWKTIGRVLET